MCAIAGEINFAGEPLTEAFAVYRRMLDTMQRRGPDQTGMFVKGPAALLHARLAVVDLAGGRQPMKGTRGEREFVLIYNGELYNTEELRSQLSGLGHTFQGHSDTEVLLHAFMEWGEDCVDRLNGIFAFAVWLPREERLFLARDRIGVKPLFYTRREGRLIFASEIKTLLAHPMVPAELDRNGIAEIMLLGPGRTPGCGVFRGIEEVQPGCCGWYDREGLKLRRYWKLEDREHTDSFEQTVEQVRFLVTDAIRRQLVSDVPICTFLSGGLDSSIISAVAAKELAEHGERLHTFSVDYKENDRYFTASKFQPNSDGAYIRQMQECLDTEHHWVVLDSPELADALYRAVDARDLPGMADVDSSLLLFCGEIKKHATVALSGECADEIFGGYPWYRDPEIREQAGFPWAQSTDWRASFLRPDLRAELDAHAFVDSRYRATVADASVRPGLDGEERRMREMVRLNFDWFMQTLLDRKDRMSMYHGLEVRVPFCDWRIAEYLYSVPWAFKDWQGREKGLLREAVRGLLPEEVLWRKKSPYPKTHHPAYLALVSRRLREVLDDPDAPLFQIVDPEAARRLLDSTLTTPWYGQLMTVPQTIAYLLQVNYWLGAYHVRLV